MNFTFFGILSALAPVRFAVLLLILAIPAESSISAQERRTILHKIKLNGKPPGRLDIVIARTDSITFELRCKIDSNVEPVPFLFNTSLKAEKLGQRQQQTLGTTVVTYTGLPEDNYLFAAQALLPGSWQALPTSISFQVNDSIANEQKRNAAALEAARLKKIYKDSVAAQLSQPPDNNSTAMFSLLGAGILGAGFLLFVLVKKRKTETPILRDEAGQPEKIRKRKALKPDATTSKRGKPSKVKRNNKANKSSLSNLKVQGTTMVTESDKQKFDNLLGENEQLRAEIAALRGQIDNLQSRSEELYRQNKVLEETVVRINEKRRDLEELHAQKDELFAMVIHDIKNPAAVVKGLVEVLNSYDLNATEQQDVMNDLMETSKKIISLSQEVCKIMALESGQVRLNYEPADLAEIVGAVCRRNESIAKGKLIGIVTDFMPELPEVDLDPQRIEEVVDNLVSNAVKFSNSGSSVRVRVKREGELVTVEVSDNGLGMTEEDIKRAFNRGAKLSARPTAGETSSGLGLWIVKRLVEDHKGRVWVRSALGRGSTFAFQIPFRRPKES